MTDLAAGRFDAGHGGFSAVITGDDTFQKVTLRTDIREALFLAKTTVDDYARFAAATEFQFSFNSDGSNWAPLNNIILQPMRYGKPIECYVKAATGTLVTITGVL